MAVSYPIILGYIIASFVNDKYTWIKKLDILSGALLFVFSPVVLLTLFGVLLFKIIRQ